MRIEAEFLYDFSLERDDLLYKKRRYTNARFGKKYLVTKIYTIWNCLIAFQEKAFLPKKKYPLRLFWGFIQVNLSQMRSWRNGWTGQKRIDLCFSSENICEFRYLFLLYPYIFYLKLLFYVILFKYWWHLHEEKASNICKWRIGSKFKLCS